MLSASCLCGGVRYEIDDGAIGPVVMCHCGMCRKATGSAYATNAAVAATAFHLRAGADLLTRYESSPGKYRYFCERCGSPVYARSPEMPDHVRIRLGLLDDDPGVRPSFHYDAESKAPWDEITDSLPRLALTKPS